MANDTAVVNIPPCEPPVCFMPEPVAPPPPIPPLLSITKTHVGNFPSGGNGTYTITVCNDPAAGPTTAPVTVVDTLPAGFAGLSMAGVGWVCDVGTLTCTRSDVLNAGKCYQPITLIVSVS